MCSSDGGRPAAFLLRLLVFLLLVGACSEVWFRTVMTPCQTPNYIQDGAGAIHRLDSHGPTDGLSTMGRLCRPVGRWHVNNAGWNCASDYLPASSRRQPLVAIFGDSYAQAMITSVDEHVDAYLSQELPGTSVYTFGLAGWYLEQYVAVSRYARERFQPDVLVVLIDDGDVRESLRSGLSFWWQLAECGGSFEEVPPGDRYRSSRMLTLAKRSALVDYLRYNLNQHLPGLPYVAVESPARQWPGQTSREHTSVGPGWYRRAADYMVGRLCAANPGVPIIFLAHGDRYLSVEDAGHTASSQDAEAIRLACGHRPQCRFVDLRPVFSRDWAVHHVRFEAADGIHWNGYANRLVAGEIAGLIRSQGLLPRARAARLSLP